MRNTLPPCLLAFLLAGCPTGTTDPGATSNTSETGDPTTTDVSGWQINGHSCPGINRTDALMVDTDGSIWIGCGSGADGDGLFVSTDGSTFSIPDTTPANVLTSFRVLSVHRGYGDLVYVAGEGPKGSMVISLDTSSTPYAATAVLTRGNTVGTSFLASPFLTTSTGAAFADSFNGGDALYRPDDTVDDAAANWTDASGWEDDGGSHQILDMVLSQDQFYGVGSTIAEPPHVFLPSQTGEAWQLTPVQLATGLGGFDGEMFGVAASSARVVAVGVDQDNNIGKIFVSGADPYDAAQYTQLDVDSIVGVSGGQSTWARGVCMDGDRVVVVGERQPLGQGGVVVESVDGGASFTDISPTNDVDTWSKCAFTSDGLVVAGSGSVGILAD